jgi:hypothetical protein
MLISISSSSGADVSSGQMRDLSVFKVMPPAVVSGIMHMCASVT